MAEDMRTALVAAEAERDEARQIASDAVWSQNKLQENLDAAAATSYAFGFKAGIEAGAEVAQGYIKYGRANELSAAFSALPTPSSMLPEILEAMRPFAEIAKKDIGDDEHDVDIFRDMQTHNRAPRLTVGHLRAIAAMFTRIVWLDGRED